MRLFVCCLSFLLCTTHFTSLAQSPESSRDLSWIYQMVLDDFLQSGIPEQNVQFGILDSTCPAVFYGGFSDTINKQFFGFDANNYIEGEVFRRNFLEFTQHVEALPPEIFAGKSLVRINKMDYKKCFSSPKDPNNVLITSKAFEKLDKLYQTKIYCELSLPYFFDDKTVLVYINYQDGPENNFSNVYLIHKLDNEWGIVAKLRGWS